MPGVASLEASQYYAFPRNVFWRIMGDLFGAGPRLDYPSRLRVLNDNRIALWDVIETCVRPGSLDSAIRDEGMETNDFGSFFQRHPRIGHVCFNGRKAADLFAKRVKPGLQLDCEYHVLPSTSPANAAKNYATKLDEWSLLKRI
jgi:TDG/mug DNA glycosylase family protein